MMRIQPLNKGRTKSWKFDGHAERDHIGEEVQERRLSQVKERPNRLRCRQRSQPEETSSGAHFATEFWFSKTTFFVRIKCSEWNQ
jgi:hypothetical protein